MVADFLSDWHQHGTDVLERVRVTEPATYLRVTAVLVPKEMKVEVEQKAGPIQAAEVPMMRRLLELIETNAPGGDTEEIFRVLEDALRFHFAKQIDASIGMTFQGAA
jgi:hypothetical protein